MNICSKHFGTSDGLLREKTNDFSSYPKNIRLIFKKPQNCIILFPAKSISHGNRSFEMNCANLSHFELVLEVLDNGKLKMFCPTVTDFLLASW